MIAFDEKDAQILAERIRERAKIDRPCIGDFVRFPNGKLERFSHDWGDDLQTSPRGSFYLCKGGNADFSGGLNPSIPLDSLSITDEVIEADFWFFHHDWPGAHRGVGCKVPCRVYSTTAVYHGFLS